MAAAKSDEFDAYVLADTLRHQHSVSSFCVSRLSDFWSAVLSSSVYRYGSMRSG